MAEHRGKGVNSPADSDRVTIRLYLDADVPAGTNPAAVGQAVSEDFAKRDWNVRFTHVYPYDETS